MEQRHIRNFSIIAHIDHGKSTLADRFLELTHTVESRRMKEQMLDTMDLERERGITIKMQPVRMEYQYKGAAYELNLIDTPGHIDFSYEVSRALVACEGAILLVDATQGVQAQTLSHFYVARALHLPMLPVINKIDVPHADVERATSELVSLGFQKQDIQRISAKEGIGIVEVLEKVLTHIPPPKGSEQYLRGLIFDSSYDEHGGIIVYTRVFDGSIKKGDKLFLLATGQLCEAKEVGLFRPKRITCPELQNGEIGYVVTGIKTTSAVRIGDTLTHAATGKRSPVTPLPGYKEPSPVVWASFFPEDQDDFFALGDALQKLHLNDASLSFQEFSTTFLGRGYQCGFLGTLHLEIIAERLRREFRLAFVVSAPSVGYRVYKKGKVAHISSAHQFPKKGEADKVEEPMIRLHILIPDSALSAIFKIQKQFEIQFGPADSFGTSRVTVETMMPLRTFVKDFFEVLHRLTSGYASVSYEHAGWRTIQLERVDVLIAGDMVEALSRVVPPESVGRESRELVESIKDVLPREQFEVRIQAVSGGRIIASAKLAAFKKDVTGYLYGGDRSRKMKLWQKQKKGKQKLKRMGRVHVSTETFVKLLRK